MSSKGKIERWLLADWNGGRLLKSSSMIRVTEEVNVGITDGSHRAVTTRQDIPSDGRNSSEGQRNSQAIDDNPGAQDNEGRDYSPSASSWEPSDEELSSESGFEHDPVSEKASFTKQYSNKNNSRRAPRPALRPNAVTNILKARLVNGNSPSIGNSGKKARKPYTRHIPVKKYSADSTKRNQTPPIKLEPKNADNNAREIEDIKAGFRELFRMLNELKPQPKNFLMELEALHLPPTDKISNTVKESEGYEEINNRSESDLSDRSDDNVLISNKYNRVEHSTTSKRNSKIDSDDEWVPIGSGKTMIHKEKFCKVKWKSFTIATRTLLLAAFPRRILATHSLTGKRSPAFRNKPAKMCLDPKIVTDIILEITSRFDVKENLVRSIITTKCADEAKMLRTRLKSKNKYSRNDENTEPTLENVQN